MTYFEIMQQVYHEQGFFVIWSSRPMRMGQVLGPDYSLSAVVPDRFAPGVIAPSTFEEAFAQWKRLGELGFPVLPLDSLRPADEYFYRAVTD